MDSDTHSYRKIPLSESSNDFEFDYQDALSVQKTSWLRRKAYYLALHATLLCLYTIVTLTIITQFGVKAPAEETDRYALTYSPARKAIKDTTYVFNAAPNLTSPYVGESRPSLDKAWHELLQNTNLRISEEDLRAVNRTSIPLGNGGGFYGELTVFHELHCLVPQSHHPCRRGESDHEQKFIRQAFHMDYYGSRFGQKEKETMREHTGKSNLTEYPQRGSDVYYALEHCIEILRQSVMCRGDTTLITFRWGHTVKLPQPDVTLEHTCVDWDSLMDWAGQHSINVFEEGMMVHPFLGPAYPGGFRDDRPRPPNVAA